MQQPPGNPDNSRTRSQWALLAATVLLIELAYVFFVSAGHMRNWHTYHTYIDYLAEGFRSRHLYLSLEPAKEMLTSANPYDGAHFYHWYWDASFYKGHYYLYWGPVPALLLAGVKTVFRISSPVGDQYPVFAFTSLQLIAAALLVERFGRRLFGTIPIWFVIMAVFVVGFANPTLYNLGRGGVYEAAITGGQAFVTLGLVFAFDAVCLAGEGTRARRRLVAAGCCWALALGCRVTLGPAILLMGIATVFATSGSGPGRWLRFLWNTLATGGPVAAGVTLLLAYNRARFGEWLEFGMRYQVSTLKFAMSKSWFTSNVWSYLFRPMKLTCEFPFAYGVPEMPEADAFPRWYKIPDKYWVNEQVIGIVKGVAWSWLAPVALGAAGWSAWRLARKRPGSEVSVGERRSLFLTVVFTIGLTTSMSLGLFMFTATMRYMGDVIGAVCLLGTIGAWWLYRRWHDRRLVRRAVVGVCIPLALLTIAIGAALGFEGQYKHFRQHNPELVAKLSKKLSVCRP